MQIGYVANAPKIESWTSLVFLALCAPIFYGLILYPLEVLFNFPSQQQPGSDRILSFRQRLRIAIHNVKWKWKTFEILSYGVFGSLLYGVPFLYRVVKQLLQHRYSEVIIASLVMILGSFAFWFKKRHLEQYGICEVIFGIVSALQISAGLKIQEAMFARWAALVGATYVVSRGLSNIADARKTRRDR